MPGRFFYIPGTPRIKMGAPSHCIKRARGLAIQKKCPAARRQPGIRYKGLLADCQRALRVAPFMYAKNDKITCMNWTLHPVHTKTNACSGLKFTSVSQTTPQQDFDASPGRWHSGHTMLYPLLRPFLFRLDPETAHFIALFALKAFVSGRPQPADPMLSVSLAGIDFPTRWGWRPDSTRTARSPI
jgi:hypothetical protein